MKDITVTVNLRGTLSPPCKHTSKQTGMVDISPIGQKSIWIKRTIKHNDRVSLTATRIFPISGSIVKMWISDEAPHWIKPHVWKKLNRDQRIMAYVARFDEGYGVSYQ